MSSLVSIDWDFFIPEKLEWDLSHKENYSYFMDIWKYRLHLRDKYRLTGDEKSLPGFFDSINKLYVSESHSCVWNLLHDINVLYLFDTHHDMWYPHYGGLVEESPSCDNWVYLWLAKSRQNKFFWIRPQHSCCNIDFYDFPISKNQIEIINWPSSNFCKNISNLKLHICRSGCWAPPWFDNNFIDFVSSFNSKEVIKIKEDLWDPFEIRVLDF